MSTKVISAEKFVPGKVVYDLFAEEYGEMNKKEVGFASKTEAGNWAMDNLANPMGNWKVKSRVVKN